MTPELHPPTFITQYNRKIVLSSHIDMVQRVGWQFHSYFITIGDAIDSILLVQEVACSDKVKYVRASSKSLYILLINTHTDHVSNS